MQFPTLGGGMRRFVLLQRLKPWANCGVPLLSLSKKLDAASRYGGCWWLCCSCGLPLSPFLSSLEDVDDNDGGEGFYFVMHGGD
jgi:hypothetical protein